MEKTLNDFKINSKVPGEVKEKYNNLVPEDIIDLWQKYGFGAFMQGLGLGGAEKVENLEKVKLKEHILIITGFIGPLQYY